MTGLMLCLAGGWMTEVNAQTKSERKEVAKLAKKEAKRLTKEGWKLLGSGGLEDALEQHLLMLKSKKYKEYSGIAGNCADVSDAVALCEAEAIRGYATVTSSEMEGFLEKEGKGVPEATVQRLHRAYTMAFETAMYGQMEPSYTVYRQLDGGLYEAQTFFLGERDAAFQAKVAALERACRLAKVEKAFEKQMKDELEKQEEEEREAEEE